ncbi:hypothetical protein CBL_11562 [Carabus blaptoides fortunei]
MDKHQKKGSSFQSRPVSFVKKQERGLCTIEAVVAYQGACVKALANHSGELLGSVGNELSCAVHASALVWFALNVAHPRALSIVSTLRLEELNASNFQTVNMIA